MQAVADSCEEQVHFEHPIDDDTFWATKTKDNWVLANRVRRKNAPSSCYTADCSNTTTQQQQQVISRNRFESAKNKQYQLERVKAVALIAGTLPLSWLLLRYLSISQSTHWCYQQTNTNSETAQTSQIVTDNSLSAVNRAIKVGIVPFSWLLLRYLLISQSTHCCHQHTNTNRETAQTKNCNRHLQVL